MALNTANKERTKSANIWMSFTQRSSIVLKGWMIRVIEHCLPTILLSSPFRGSLCRTQMPFGSLVGILVGAFGRAKTCAYGRTNRTMSKTRVVEKCLRIWGNWALGKEDLTSIRVCSHLQFGCFASNQERKTNLVLSHLACGLVTWQICISFVVEKQSEPKNIYYVVRWVCKHSIEQRNTENTFISFFHFSVMLFHCLFM